jgi:hypothetical protein
MANRLNRKGNVLLVLFQVTRPESTPRTRETVEPSWPVILQALEDLRLPTHGTLHLVRIDLDRVGAHPRESWEHDAAHESKLMIGHSDGRGYLLHAEIREPEALPMYHAVNPHIPPNSESLNPTEGDPTDVTQYIVEEADLLGVVRTFVATGTLDPVVTWVEDFPAWRTASDA